MTHKQKTGAGITGVKTEAQKAKALATAKGPKPGSARSNQTVKLSAEDQKAITAEAKSRKAPAKSPARALDAKPSKVAKMADSAAKITKPDVIKEVKSTVGGNHVAVTANGGKSLTYPNAVQSAELAKLAAVGASFKAVEAYLRTHKPEAKLAKGLDSRNAPQSAMAAAESRGPVGKGAKVPASTVTQPAGGAGAKAKGASGASSKGDFSYKVGKANDTRPDTWTHYMVATIQKHTDSASAKKAHEKSGHFTNKKLDFTWAKLKGFIK